MATVLTGLTGVLDDRLARRSADAPEGQNPGRKIIIVRVEVRRGNAKHLGQLFGGRKMGEVLALLVLIDSRAATPESIPAFMPSCFCEMPARSRASRRRFPTMLTDAPSYRFEAKRFLVFALTRY